jgi:hypothetical protein
LDLSGNNHINDVVGIRLNRKLFALITAFFGIFTAVGVYRALATGNTVAALIVLVVIGGPCLLYLRGLVRRGPAMVIDSSGLAGFRVKRPIEWANISDIHVAQRQGVFGVYHHLVLTVRREDQPPVEDAHGLLTSRVPTETVEFSIDQLAMPWNEIVAAVQGRLGRSVATKKEAGPFTRAGRE